MCATATNPSLSRAPRIPLVAGGGCAAKLGPGELASMLALAGVGQIADRRVLVGLEAGDDAAVVRLSDDLAMVQTVDFFPPVVDDAETFGAIAAANAMSDVFAMGGRVVSALAVMMLPDGTDPDVPAAILRGAAGKLGEAGGSLVGGHTVIGPQLTFGLSVTGVVHPDLVLTRAAARVGDRLYLTKPLGTALLTTAWRMGRTGAAELDGAVASMLRLNLAGSGAAIDAGASAMTDVTGFGLLGHLSEMVARSGVRAVIDAPAVPALPGALAAAEAGALCGGLHRNQAYWLAGPGAGRCPIDRSAGVTDAVWSLLWDPQTSGGLLVAVGPDRVDAFEAALAAADLPCWPIGTVMAGRGIEVDG